MGGTLPEDLEELVPGPELAAVLAGVDRAALDCEDLLRLARARQRLVAHQEAQQVADLHAVARAVPDHGPQPGRRDPGKYPWAECEVAFALRWTYGRAAGQLILADELVDRLPRVFAALDAGVIDMPKARLLADAVAPLDGEVAAGIVDAVIEQAPRLTTGELRARLRRLVIAADPDAAVRRATRDSADRRVEGFVNDHNQLAALAGYELAPHRVAAVTERLDAIARAAKAGGDPRRVDQLRADVFLDLLVGEGIAAGGPITDGGVGGRAGTSTARRPDRPAITAGEPAAPPEPAPPGGGPHGRPPAGERRGVDRAPEEVPWPASPADPDLLAELAAPPGRVPADPGAPADLWAVLPPPAPGAPRPAGCGCGTAGDPAPALPGPRSGVVDLQVPLLTLMGLSALPGELDGWAPVVADVARQVAAERTRASWRFSVYDNLGELVHHGTTRARPGSGASLGDGGRGRRRPSAEVAAFVRARDRRCVAPGCRRAARGCDIDHTVDWVRGGDSGSCNLGLLCRMHHLLKHATGCELVQLSPGTFGWTTPARRQYVTLPDRPLIDDNELAGLAGRRPGPGAPGPPPGREPPGVLIPAADVLDPGG